MDRARRPTARPTDRRSPARHPRPADRRGACAPGGGNGPGARCRAPADAGRQGQLLRHPRADQRGPGTARRPLFGDQVPVARLQLRLRPLGRRARRLGSRPRPGQCRPDRQPGRAHRPLGEHRPRLQRPRPRLYRARSRRGRTEALAAHDRAEPEAHERRARQQGPAATDADPAGHRPPAAQRRRAGHRQRPHRPRRAAGQGARSRSRTAAPATAEPGQPEPALGAPGGTARPPRRHRCRALAGRGGAPQHRLGEDRVLSQPQSRRDGRPRRPAHQRRVAGAEPLLPGGAGDLPADLRRWPPPRQPGRTRRRLRPGRRPAQQDAGPGPRRGQRRPRQVALPGAAGDRPAPGPRYRQVQLRPGHASLRRRRRQLPRPLSVQQQLLVAERQLASLESQQIDLSVQLVQALGGGFQPDSRSAALATAKAPAE